MPYPARPSTLSPVYVRSEVVAVQVWGYPGKGMLEVHVYYRGVEVSATVTIINPATGQEIGTYVTEQFPIMLDVGNYLLKVNYDNYVASQTVQIIEGQTTIWRVYIEPKRVCFVATACYGYEHPALETFRTFRDGFLMRNVFGRKFVHLYYYVIGKPIAKFLLSHLTIRKTVKTILNILYKITRRVV